MLHSLPRLARVVALAGSFAVLAACGGGGGGDGPSGPQTPAPTVTLTANPTSVASGGTTTLTWTTLNATSCTASGGWTGAKGTSGSETSAALTAATTFTLECTGSGGTNSASASVTIAAAPTVTLTASVTSVVVTGSVDLTWSSTNATSCTASDGWSGSRPTSGSASSGPLAANANFVLTCTGPGGNASQSVAVTVGAPPAGNVVISGRITFDRIVFKTTPGEGLNPSAPVESPARGVVVEAVTGAATVLGATATDSDGRYALIVPVSSSVLIRARAQMLKTGAAPTWNFRVLNNTNSDALYVLNGTAADSGTANSTRNLRATTTYPSDRFSGPFAILDTIYQSKAMILAADPAAVFADLDLFWSIDNRPASPFCPNNGNIGTSFYTGPGSADDCVPSNVLPAGIYILGDYAGGSGDTDEFDQHVIAHEFGHYFEANFSRSDSPGGDHQGGDRLDLRLAFGEGWGDAFSAMSLNDPAYRDSQSGTTDEFGFNLEQDSNTAEGWFSEFSVMEILWDLFDGASDGADTVALGFAPMFTVMTNDEVDTNALTSIFTFADALRSRNSSSASQINALLTNEGISVTDEFASGETHDGGSSTALPVYTTINIGTPVTLCSSATFGDTNKLGYSRFFTLDLSSQRTVAIQATGVANGAGTAAAQDPDIFVYRQGVEVVRGIATGSTELIPQRPLAAGTYIIEVYDFELAAPAVQSRCFSVSIQG